MNKRPINYLTISLIICSLIFSIVSCGNRPNRNQQVKVGAATNKEHTLDKAIFYLENSESMFGYVNGITNYVDVVSELSEKPEFVAQKIIREFYFINGGNTLSINSLGTNPAILKNKLNQTGFRCGDITKSNLNSMLQVALEKAQNGTISILISDAIYDVGQLPLSALPTVGKETRSKFITRLENGDIQTLLIKLKSNFNGNYFYCSHSGTQFLNQERPFYVWIFGKSELLNEYFSEEYISQHLKGYENFARFLALAEKAIPNQIVSFNRKGAFKVDREIANRLIEVKPDRNGQGFQFAIAVDFSSLPFSENYLTSTLNYNCNLNYKTVKIEKITEIQKFEVHSFTHPTHLITLFTNQNPCGNLKIVLKNEVSNWIKDTDIVNENSIDNSHTYGFKILTDAISEAYAYKSKGKYIAQFDIEISN